MKTNILASSIKGIFVPHAGLRYSGLCTATAFTPFFKQKQKKQKKIVFLSTDHSNTGVTFIRNKKIIYSGPLGKHYKLIVPQISKSSSIKIASSSKYTNEHSLKNIMPFVDYTLGSSNKEKPTEIIVCYICLLYTSPSPRD